MSLNPRVTSLNPRVTSPNLRATSSNPWAQESFNQLNFKLAALKFPHFLRS